MTASERLRPRRAQAERSSASTEAMLNAAVELILDHGARVSMMAIGQKSGYSHGLVLARFGSKAGLIRAVTQRVQRSFTATIEAAVGEAKGLRRLLGLVDAFFASTAQGSVAGRAFYVLLGEALGPDPELRAAYLRIDGLFRRFIEGILLEARDLGEIPATVDPTATAALLVGMLRGTGMQFRINDQAFDLSAVHAEARSFIERLRLPPYRSPRRSAARQRMPGIGAT